jgi:hypothetical protein
MQSLDEEATAIFLELIGKLKGGQYTQLEAGRHMPLYFECVGHMVSGKGQSNIYSMMHSFLEEGDLMRHPEMCFLHFYENGDQISGIVPYSYSLDSLGLYEESVVFRSWHQVEVNGQLHTKHVRFANQWLRNIKEQGYLL